MARVFQLGEFFGITATQIAVMQPESFNKLLVGRYTERINEGLYSLSKEFEYLKAVFISENKKPDYEKLIPDFKSFEYLGLTEASSNGKVKQKISKFYNDYLSGISKSELAMKYDESIDNIKEIIAVIEDSLSIDIVSLFPESSANARKLMQLISDNMQYVNDVYHQCRDAYNNSRNGDKLIAGRAVRDILRFDENTLEGSSEKSCNFTGQLYNKVMSTRNQIERQVMLDEVEANIKSIQREYDAEDIHLTDISEIRNNLYEVCEQLSKSVFVEKTGIDLTDDEFEKLFIELDGYLIGGLGFNTSEMAENICKSIEAEDTTSWTKQGRSHNRKLDAVLRIAFMDLKSKQFMFNNQ